MVSRRRNMSCRFLLNAVTVALLVTPVLALAQIDPGQQALQTMQITQQAAEQAQQAAQQANQQAMRDAQQANQQAMQAAANTTAPVPRHPGYGIADKPSFSPKPGSFRGPVRVAITDPGTPKAEIFYTLDGSRPTSASTPYNGPLLVNATTRLRAVARSPIYSESRITGGKYTIH